tara:strand:- start:115 stop:312 length:198 start_codon:yes stop_codon:yes gene_type:complete
VEEVWKNEKKGEQKSDSLFSFSDYSVSLVEIGFLYLCYIFITVIIIIAVVDIILAILPVVLDSLY